MKVQTSDLWHKELYPNITIMDPDGWDRTDSYYYSFYEEKITKEEFEKRLAVSTIMLGKIK